MKKIIFLLLLISSCARPRTADIDIFCPEAGGRRVMVANATIDDIIYSARRQIDENIKDRTSVLNSTIIRTRNGATILINDLAPQQLLRCQMNARQKGDLQGYVLQS